MFRPSLSHIQTRPIHQFNLTTRAALRTSPSNKMHLQCTALIAGLAALTISIPVGLPAMPDLGMSKRSLSDAAAPAPRATRPDFYTVAGCNSGDNTACSLGNSQAATPTEKTAEGTGLDPIIGVAVDYKREEPKLGRRGFKATPVEKPPPDKRAPRSPVVTWGEPGATGGGHVDTDTS